jgi:hypothetical protein
VPESLNVSPTELRLAASNLDTIGAALLGDAPLPPPDPGWAATEALSALLALVHGGMVGLARRCAETAIALRVAADAYEDADHRAAGRSPAAPGGGRSW